MKPPQLPFPFLTNVKARRTPKTRPTWVAMEPWMDRLKPPALVLPTQTCVVLYTGPPDQPDAIVVCRYNLRAAERASIHPHRDAAREMVPKGMVNIGRSKQDDASILEVWL